MKQLRGFDPLVFLKINNIDPKDRNKLSFELMSQISEYLVIRTLQLLPPNKTENMQSPEELFDLVEQLVPDFNDKISQFLNDFKMEYAKNLDA